MISVWLAMIEPPGAFTGPMNAPAVHVTVVGVTTTLPPVGTGCGASTNDMPSTDGIVTVTPAGTGFVVLLLSRTVIGNFSPGFTQPTEETKEYSNVRLVGVASMVTAVSP